LGTIRGGFVDPQLRRDLIELARDGPATHRLARRANALVLLDAVAKVVLLDDVGIGSWYRLNKEDGPDGLASRGYEGSAWRLGVE
jgi:hypothetical protein